MNELIVMSSS